MSARPMLPAPMIAMECSVSMLTALREPVGVQLGPPVPEEEPPRMALPAGRQVYVGDENVIFAAGRAGDHRTIGCTDEGIAREREALLGAHPVAERDPVAVLEGGHPHLRLVQAVR